MVESGPDFENLSLAAAYDRVGELLDGPDGISAASPDTAQQALQLLSHCELLMQRAALFSSNEDADDLITSQLKYLLVGMKQCHSLHAAVTVMHDLQYLQGCTPSGIEQQALMMLPQEIDMHACSMLSSNRAIGLGQHSNLAVGC
jgi:hypothetical protein